MILALTCYGAKIPKAFSDAKHAKLWAAENAERYGCSRIVRATEKGQRTIWRPAQVEVA